MLHTITMFAEETKLGREDNLFLNTKGLICVLRIIYLSFGNSEKLGKFFFRAAKNQQHKNFNKLLEFYDFSRFLIKDVIRTESHFYSHLISKFYWVYNQFIVIKLQDITEEKNQEK